MDDSQSLSHTISVVADSIYLLRPIQYILLTLYKYKLSLNNVTDAMFLQCNISYRRTNTHVEYTGWFWRRDSVAAN